jgi:uncharacterized phage-associated protein
MPNLSMAIANEFLRKPGGIGVLTQMQLQKLTYIAHGWNLALNGARLVTDELQAWDYGPVFPMLYEHAKFFGKSPINRLITDRDDNKVSFFIGKNEEHASPYVAVLTPQEREIIDRVWNRYSRYSAYSLSDLTHKPGTPWYETYFGPGKNSEITDDLVRQHYLTLANSAPIEAVG